MAQKLQNRNRESAKSIDFRRILYVAAVPVVAIAVVICGVYLNSHIEVSNAQASMKEYLQKKYGQEFVVEKPERKGGGLAVEGHMEAVAYPKASGALRFEVKKSSSDIWDGYADKVWATDETDRIRPEMDRIMVQPGYKYEIKIGSYLVRSSVKTPLPALNDLIDKYGEDVLYTLEVKSNASDKTTNYNRIVLLTQMLRGRGSDIRFIYTWVEGEESHRVSLGKKDIEKLLNGSIEVKDVDRVTK